MKFVVSAAARRDLERHVDWLDIRSPAAAERALNEILTAFDLLADFPEIGRAAGARREWPVKFGRDGLVVIYTVSARRLRIERVRHGRERR